MGFTAKQIAAFLGGDIEGNADIKVVEELADIQHAQPNQVTFLSNPKYEPFIYSTSAAVVIVEKGFVPKKNISPTLIRVEDAYLSFTKLLEKWVRTTIPEKSGIEQPSHQGKDITMGDNVYQGAFSYVGDHTKIGNNVKIYPHAFIGDNVVIGDNTVIYTGAKLYATTQIGKHCTIHAGAVVGSDGFGFAPQKDGSYKAIPQLGNVVVGDNVNIGANTTIDCATLLGKSTTIESGVKLDNLVQVAHNVEVGENTVIAAQAGISGSTRVGKQCLIAGQVGVIGHLSIADNTSLAAQSGVIKSVEQQGQKLLGSPTLEVANYLRSYAVFKQLPQLRQRIEQLEKQLLTQRNMNNGMKCDYTESPSE